MFQMFRFGLFAITATLAATVSLASASPARADSVSDFITKWDSDQDKTLDLAEINKAANAGFDKLDVDHDGTLDPKELGNRVMKTEFAAADADHDGTLDKTEYETIVAKRFKAANRDSDSTIDVAELKTTSGHHLLQILQ
jgi:Ca2+-binding EF-hand superfamily protein